MLRMYPESYLTSYPVSLIESLRRINRVLKRLIYCNKPTTFFYHHSDSSLFVEFIRFVFRLSEKDDNHLSVKSNKKKRSVYAPCERLHAVYTLTSVSVSLRPP